MLLLWWIFLRYFKTVRVKTEDSFTAEDPWNQNQRTAFTVEAYVKTLHGAAPRPGFKAPFGDYLYGIRSNVDGVERMLPGALIQLWRSKQVPTEALPRLLKEIEPTLKKRDYGVVGKKRLALATGLLWFAFGLLTFFLILISFGSEDYPLSPAIIPALVVWGFSWLILYFVYRAKWRRTRQMEWILARR